ncbi:MAG: ATP-grasp domain-containing protein [Acidimicrobiales bacterium]
MTPASADRGQPLLVIGYGQRSAPAMQIVEAARDLCGILWLIDESGPDSTFTTRLLKKVGTVVNIAGLSLDETTAQLRAHAPDGIVAYRDEDIVLLSLIAEELGLDYRTPGVARSLVDKLVQRDAFRVGGLPTPACWEVPADRDPAAIAAFAAEVHFPAVLKPRVGSGGQFTMPVANADDLVRSVVLLPPRAGGEEGMFVEQYLPSLVAGPSERFGSYVSVESLISDGEISHLAVTGRFPPAEPFRETGFFIPAALSQAQLTGVLEVATAALRALGLSTGDSHTEIKLTPDGPRVIEVNGRIGGGVPEMLFQACGVSIFELSMRVALGETVVVDGPIPCASVGWRFMFQPPRSAHRIVSIEGLDRLAEQPGVNEVFVNRSPGDPVDWHEGTRHYIYSVYGVSTDYDELLEIDRFIHEEVSIVYE